MYARDDGRRQALDPIEHAVPEIHELRPARVIRRELLHDLQVGAGAERAPGACERHGTDARIVIDRRARQVEISQQLVVDGVQLVGAVEHDVRDASLTRQAHRAHDHSRRRSSGDVIVSPPSRRIVCPVRNPAASDAR